MLALPAPHLTGSIPSPSLSNQSLSNNTVSALRVSVSGRYMGALHFCPWHAAGTALGWAVRVGISQCPELSAEPRHPSREVRAPAGATCPSSHIWWVRTRDLAVTRLSTRVWVWRSPEGLLQSPLKSRLSHPTHPLPCGRTVGAVSGKDAEERKGSPTTSTISLVPSLRSGFLL